MKTSEKLIEAGRLTGDYWLINRGKEVANLEEHCEILRLLLLSCQDGMRTIQSLYNYMKRK